MKFTIQGPFNENVYNLMRKIGYIFVGKNEVKNELSFVRPLEMNGYPRFHVYLKTEGENLDFNLHLDQKKPVYNGSPAHSGEYEGGLLDDETQRIKKIAGESIIIKK